ncbi:MAG: STAS domain-containing protein [Solirubrobacterales bacterium]|nr:STAS domain-containing protein [Solirubrobacterales bacterium]
MESSLDRIPQEPSPAAFAVTHRVLDDRVCVVTVEGDLDLAAAPQLKWTLVELLEKGYAQYVIDLSQLTYMDSMGLGVLVGFRKRVEGSAQLALACMPATQRKLLEMTGLDACFDSFGTLDEALSTNGAGSLPLCTDAAMALGLAATAMPFAASRRAEALRWLRILRLHGEAARVLCALGVGEAPLGEAGHAEAVESHGTDTERDDRDPVGAVSELAARLARKREAASVGTGDILLAAMRFYGPDFDRVLAAHGTDRDEVIARLAA